MKQEITGWIILLLSVLPEVVSLLQALSPHLRLPVPAMEPNIFHIHSSV